MPPHTIRSPRSSATIEIAPRFLNHLRQRPGSSDHVSWELLCTKSGSINWHVAAELEKLKPNPLESITMRRVITPLLLALAFAAFSSVDASAGLFGHHRSGCDAGCAVEPACGCEAPVCGCAVAPACGCEAACDPCAKRPNLLARLFHRHHNACDACCAPAPVCGCEVVAPACGCEAPCAAPRRGLLHRLFHHHGKGACDAGCGCGAAPSCGCEPTCGF